uniref:Nudix hydrolase n=1 Tax=Tetraselmis sp. GSL018 TaxID=582737 RepID=A0A061S4N4_9CHLO
MTSSICRSEKVSEPPENGGPPDSFHKWSKFCRKCGAGMSVVDEGDKTWRHMCINCKYIDYFNPKMVVGCIVEHEGRILLCKRGIDPCKGKWTVPAGFMELDESTAGGAARETYEEAAANVEIVAPYFHLDIPAIGQSYVLFRSKLAEPYTFSSGTETLDVKLFEPDAVPFQELAFSSVSIALRHYIEDLRDGRFRVHHAEIEKLPGSAPNDPHSFRLRNHMQFRIESS